MDIEKYISENTGAVIYFTAGHCNVCKVLKPAIREMLAEKFPKMQFLEIDTLEYPDLAAKYQAFSIPLILVYFDGKEFFRKGRAMSVQELAGDIARPYAMLFEE